MATIIYGKPGWPYTDKAREAYSGHEYFDVSRDENKLKEMLDKNGGKRQVPTIVEDGNVQVGYGGSWGVWTLTVCEQQILTPRPGNCTPGLVVGRSRC